MSEPACKLRVLVVDDEPMIGGVLQRMLKSDYAVVTTTSAEEGIAKLEQAQFCAVVTDTNLGSGMWGPEFLTEVQRRWPNLARVIMSGGDQGVAWTARESGLAHVFLAKPWGPNGPQEAIAAALEMVAAERRSA